MAETNIVPINAAMNIERALYKLHGALTSTDYKSLVASLPDIIKNTILPALGNILKKVTDVVKQFVNAETLAKLKTVLDTSLDVVSSTMDMLPEAVQRAAEMTQRFLNVVKDFIAAGANHITAIIDLLAKIGAALENKPETDTKLLQTTIDTAKLLAA